MGVFVSFFGQLHGCRAFMFGAELSFFRVLVAEERRHQHTHEHAEVNPLAFHEVSVRSHPPFSGHVCLGIDWDLTTAVKIYKRGHSGLLRCGS